MVFVFETTVSPDWIDYNGHMRDAYFGLIFSLAVDALQDEVGFDQTYRERTGCTIYLIEDHKFYLREVKEGAALRVETRVLGCDEKRFHLHLSMLHGAREVAICEFMEIHVAQRPAPHATPIPQSILARLEAARASEADIAALTRRARALSIPGV